ncbi:MAG: flagellar hook capping protein [Oscillospiraceae bacterium]|nr:flagellar hook capping protein [Oscillospiraceae bacterium]
MSDFIGDISSYLAVGGNAAAALAASQKKDNTSLDMTDFLTLMVAQFQNQSIDNTADTSDMLNQLVQMSVVQAITNITDATVMMYAGSLVGKEVTVGTWNGGELQETVGTVTGTGMAGGQQVIFVNGKSYYLSDIMAVGRLPDVEAPGETPEDPEVDPTEPPEGSDNDHSTDNSGENPNIPEE